MIKCYFDGACEPNNDQGTMAYGGIIYQHEQKIHDFGYLYPSKNGIANNNIAEYCGLIAILRCLIHRQLTAEEIYIFGDSKLVIEQMNGRWQLKSGKYLPYAERAKNLLEQFIEQPFFEWIPKERNTIANDLSRRYL